MTEKTENLTDEQMKDVAGGRGKGRYEKNWEPYVSEHFPVSCPKCNSHYIWYIPGKAGMTELNEYWCKACDHKFNDSEIPGGASDDWNIKVELNGSSNEW